MLETSCRECGGTIWYLPLQGQSAVMQRILTPKVCETCTPIVDARLAEEERESERREALERKAKRAKEWEAICPPLYRDTDLLRLPEVAVAAIAAWEYGPRGLAFCGASGRGKTRAMMVLARRMHVDHGKRVTYLTSAEFSHKVSRFAGDKMEALDEFLNGLCRASVLFLDDVGKGRMTDRVESELYHVVEQRTANLRPILFTANAGSDALAGSMSEDRGVPIVRRLAEFCQVHEL